MVLNNSGMLTANWWRAHNKSVALIRSGKYPPPKRRWPTYHEWAICIVFVFGLIYAGKYLHAAVVLADAEGAVARIESKNATIKRLLDCINGVAPLGITVDGGARWDVECSTLERRRDD